ncbi:MAG: transglutaminase family protein [Ruminococcus sp.]|nr:transglutaminase family protein [Ruminococcus sp.]
MKTSNIFKTAAFVTAAAFTITTTGSYAGEIFLKDGNSASIGSTQSSVKRAPAEAVIVEDGVTDIQKLNYAFENGSSERVAELCDSILAGMEADMAETEAVAADISTWADDEIIDRQQRYESELNVKYAETSKALAELKDGINTEANLALINEELAEPEEYHKSDAVPNIAVQPEELTVSASAKASSAEIVSPAATADDLVYDRDVIDPAAIKSLADKLGSAKEIYLFVKNNVVNEAYAGSKKDPSITLEQLGGNDIDQAALLVSLLRAKGIPARFISGTVRITPEQAVELTGAADASSAGRILAARYKNTARLNHNGQLVGFKMSHTWVEAYIPYTDYRGAGNAKGGSVWVQLDPSFKKVEIKKESVTPEFSENDKQYLDMVDKGKADIPGLFDEINTSPDKVDVYFRRIANGNDEYIPSSLPYTVLEANQRYSFVKDEDKASISISIDGEKLMDASVAELYSKPLVISYEPASSSDNDVVKRYEELTDVPAYLVNVVPVVTFAGQKAVGKKAISLGSVQKMVTEIHDGTGTTMLDDSVFAGSMYAVNLDLQRISAVDAQAAENRLKKAEQDFSKEKTFTPEIMGAFLDYAGKYYFTLCDSQIAVYALENNIEQSRQLGLAITGFEFNSHYSCGIVNSLENGSFHIDVAYNNSEALNRDGNKDIEKQYNTTIGVVESYYEGYIWEQLVDKENMCLSTVSIMQTALNSGIEMSYIGKANVEEELAKCNIEPSVKQEVRNFVNRGMKVELIPETIKIGDWTGTAYIAYDNTTGSASYMISGGTAGGASHSFESLLEFNLMLGTINSVIAFANMSVGIVTFETGVATMNPGEILVGMAGSLSGAYALGSAFKMRYDSLLCVFDYIEQGDSYIEEFERITADNIRTTIANAAALIASPFTGPISEMVSIVTTAYSAADTTDSIIGEGLSAEDIGDIASLILDIIGMAFG